MSSKETTLPLYWGILPYVAVFIGLRLLDQALLAVLIYHAGILVSIGLNRQDMRGVFKGFEWKSAMGWSAVCLLTAPALYFLWPWIKRPETDLAEMLVAWGITGTPAVGFVLYSITLHPVLEETFWRKQMPACIWSDLLFAGFHVVVIQPWVHAIWLPVVLVCLMMASWIWRRASAKLGGLWVPILSHSVADLGIVTAVIFLIR